MNLNSKHWCDIIFEGRNKKYGAYQLRRASSRRHAIAFLVTVAIAAIMTGIPMLIDAVSVSNYGRVSMNGEVHISLLQMEETNDIKKYLQQHEAPPQQKNASPVIVDKSEISNTAYVESIMDDNSKKKNLI